MSSYQWYQCDERATTILCQAGHILAPSTAAVETAVLVGACIDLLVYIGTQ